MKKLITKQGFVSLVGAGPGDPGLITVKGAERLKEADVILYDYLANSELLNLSSDKCQKICVGKRRTNKKLSQSEIISLMIKEAKKGRYVVRLKGGDPLVFGRGGEEALALYQAHINFEIIPGVSAGIGVSAYAGIPLTHREHSSDVVFVTGESGHDLSDAAKYAYWQRVSQSYTLVIFMGLANLAENMSYLIKCGKNPKTPAAIISFGTYVNQKKIIGTISNIAELATNEGIKAPSLIVIGDVVNYSHELDWFSRLPLRHKNVLVLRHEGHESTMSKRLTQMGAEVFHCPLSQITPLSGSILKEKMSQLKQYTWLILTSVTGALCLIQYLRLLKKDVRSIGQLKIAVIGESTAHYLQSNGVVPDFVSKKANSEGFVSQFKKKISKRDRVVYARGDLSRGVIAEQLSGVVAKYKEIIVYKNRSAKLSFEQLNKLKQFRPHYVIITSSSLAERMNLYLSSEQISSAKLVALGPITCNSLKKLGYRNILVSKKATMDSVYESILLDAHM